MKITTQLSIILVIVASSFSISTKFEVKTTKHPSEEDKTLLRKWTYVMVEVPSVREILSQASSAESRYIKDQYAKALKGTYLKFNPDNTFEVRKSANATPTKGTWRYDTNDERKLYMKEDSDEKEQETFIAKLNRKQLILTNGKEDNQHLVQIFLVPFE